MKVLIGCTGSVATIKVPELVKKLQDQKHEVEVVVTVHAKHFLNKDEVVCRVWEDQDEWSNWKARGDPVIHIELAKWADVFVIAPLDANTMAKLSYGMCDNLLTCIVRAWDISKPFLFCPAMNVKMYTHPITAEQIAKLKSFGYTEIPAIAKTLICGDYGIGAMAEIKTIIDAINCKCTSCPSSHSKLL